MIFGVDVFDGYGLIDWRSCATLGGVRFALLRCTVGNDPAKDDHRFLQNAAGAKAAGIAVAPYHFDYALRSGQGRPAGRSPQEQMERFFKVSGGLGSLAGDLPPVLDQEWPPQWAREDANDPNSHVINMWDRWDVDAEFIAGWTLEALEIAEHLWGRTPILYTDPNDWKNLEHFGKIAAFARYGLWIANYTHSGPGMPPDNAHPFIPGPWMKEVIWQYSAQGSVVRVPGIPACPVDRDCIRDEATFARLLSLDPTDVPPAPVSNGVTAGPGNGNVFVTDLDESLDAQRDDFEKDEGAEEP